MPKPQAPASARELVHQINERLDVAVGVALAALVYAEAGDPARALAILRDMDPPLYEVTILLNAASLLRANLDRKHNKRGTAAS